MRARIQTTNAKTTCGGARPLRSPHASNECVRQNESRHIGLLRSLGHSAVLRHVHRHHHGASQDHNRQTSAPLDLTTRKIPNETTKMPLQTVLFLFHGNGVITTQEMISTASRKKSEHFKNDLETKLKRSRPMFKMPLSFRIGWPAPRNRFPFSRMQNRPFLASVPPISFSQLQSHRLLSIPHRISTASQFETLF